MDHSSTSRKLRFMGGLVKANALVTGSLAVNITVNSIIVFRKQPSAEKYLTNIFSPVFLRTFRKFL